jgi:hypothetical protein
MTDATCPEDLGWHLETAPFGNSEYPIIHLPSVAPATSQMATILPPTSQVVDAGIQATVPLPTNTVESMATVAVLSPALPVAATPFLTPIMASSTINQAPGTGGG